MFGRLATVRIKNAEEALANGRFEDALGIAAAPDLRNDRRAKQLLDQLVRCFLQRGQDHILSRRFADALADFDRAARCGLETKKVDEWRDRARRALQENQRAEYEKEDALAIAKERLATGRLTEAADAVADLPQDDADARELRGAIARRTEEANGAIAAAASELKAGRVVKAVERFTVAQRLHTEAKGSAELESNMVDHVLKQATESFKEGRLDRAEKELATIHELTLKRRSRTDLTEAVRLARESARALAEDRYARAGVLLGRLAQIGPKAGWISDVRKHLSVLEQHRRTLLEGPLGLLSGKDVPSEISARTTSDDETLPGHSPHLMRPRQSVFPPHAQPADAAAKLPKRLLLRIDGAGSYLLLRPDRIGIGRAGPGASADLQLISDLADRQAEIIRAGEDYFVVSSAGVQLAGRQTDHALLQDGDKIRLGKRIRLKFLRPSRKSTAAVLELGDGVRTTTDCRRAILWSGPLLMGGTRECHINLGPALGNAILVERGERLYVKEMGPTREAVPLSLGVQTQIGAIRLSIDVWPASSGGRKATT
ncbi:MAG: hypothetical protein ABII12_08505 [Planctomycetota bacterium]